ncbi:TPA: 30S ribosomal protein S11 [Candidatus Taylorbacteria bacterium]|nr:30S ribosomal protein S11 [Candidatus Taylorbacteria bacterium]
MGKKRIITKGESEAKTEGAPKAAVKAGKRRVDSGKLYVQSTYNNTLVSVSDRVGNVLMASSSGALGFRGAKKGTPFAAAKVGETLGAKAQEMGVKEVAVVVCGVGSGRESAIRGFISKGINITSITDMTPVPFNGPSPKKPRRV